ncbi:hypothetical protein [Gordonia westfalica]|uniref:Uncharacterized protein n=1 Tax=Gordonia westfalica TaxID=158898 RepID=A0A1H2E386_9ACTN|nr:hypothetical protein [Gordonia westfalica]SDT89571.1 hypothetical protein SAMN04488548_12748 [Gordonia westfalica]
MTVTITSLLTSTVDPQRPGVKLPATLDPIRTLAGSLQGHPLIVLADEVDEGTTSNITVVRVPASTENVYIARWRNTLSYLESNTSLDEVWCVDGTDVELINAPPACRPGTMFVGFEHTVVGCSWMRRKHPSQAAWINEHEDLTLLNPGVIGGHRKTVVEFLTDMLQLWDKTDRSTDIGDMGVFNETCYTTWADRHVTGPRVVTPYKLVWAWNHSNEHAHSAFRHK